MNYVHGGSGSGYARGCRCAACSEAHWVRTKRRREARHEELAEVTAQLPHGDASASTYNNWGCRCEPCVAANSAKCKERRVRRLRQASDA